MPPRWRTWIVLVDRHDPAYYAAPTASAARAAAYSDYASAYGVSFRDFLRHRIRVSVAPDPEPPSDGYDYIRRNYGFAGRIGSRIRIRREGPGFNGREAWVVYPGRSTAYVRAVIDGEKHISSIHPDSVEVLAEEAAAA